MRRTCAVLIACACAAQGFTAAQPVRVTDDRGIEVRLAAPAARIVTLAPFLAELAFAAGAGGRVVGVSRYSDHPPAAAALPVVSDAVQADYERVVALRADLVLAWASGNPTRNVQALERLGLPVAVFEPRRLEDVGRIVRAIGTLAGTPVQARRAAAAFERDAGALAAHYAGREPVRVFYEIWRQPLTTVNGAHLVSDGLSRCGGVNVFAGAAAFVPIVSLEAVVATKPQVIIGGGPDGPEAFVREWRKWLAQLPGFKPRIVYVDPGLMQSLSPRMLEGLRVACAGLDAARVRAAGG